MDILEAVEKAGPGGEIYPRFRDDIKIIVPECVRAVFSVKVDGKPEKRGWEPTVEQLLSNEWEFYRKWKEP